MVLRHLGQDVKVFASFTAFEPTNTQVVDIARQTEAWLKSQRQCHSPRLPTFSPVMSVAPAPTARTYPVPPYKSLFGDYNERARR